MQYQPRDWGQLLTSSWSQPTSNQDDAERSGSRRTMRAQRPAKTQNTHGGFLCETLRPRWVAFSRKTQPTLSSWEGADEQVPRARVRVVQKVSELACAGQQFGLPGSLEAAHRVHASSIVRTMLSCIFMQVARCGRQTHRCCTVPMLRRKSC